MDTTTQIVTKHQTSSLPLSLRFDHAGQILQVSSITHSYRIHRTSDMTQEEFPKNQACDPAHPYAIFAEFPHAVTSLQ